MDILTIFADGGARNNPGPAGIGVVFYSSDGKVKYKYKGYIGIKTNNQAEYAAVICALEKAKKFKPEKIIVNLDSKLLVEQISGRFKTKNETLKNLFWQARDKIMELGGNVEFRHIPRDKNKAADKLVNLAIDEELQKTKKS